MENSRDVRECHSYTVLLISFHELTKSVPMEQISHAMATTVVIELDDYSERRLYCMNIVDVTYEKNKTCILGKSFHTL